MSIISVSLTGVVTIHLTDWDNEAVTAFHTGPDGTIYSPPTDPKSNGVAQLVKRDPDTGEWSTIPVSVPGLNNAEHMYGVATEGSTLLVCGSHLPDTAFVWESEDGGVTWTEEVGHASGIPDGYLRFYEFWRDQQGRLAVTCQNPNATYKRINGAWEQVAYEQDPDPYDREPGQVYINSQRYLVLSNGTSPGAVSSDKPWSATGAPDGRVWLSDGENIYLYDPTP